MPLTIASVFNFIPTAIWQPLKKFATKDRTVVFDLTFKISTKYTPALLIVMMCLSFANQFVRNIDLDCTTNGLGGKVSGQQGYASSDIVKLNDFCWNHETFIVAKALEPEMRGLVTYPGVSGYKRGTDKTLAQRYYKYVWLIFGQLTVMAFCPYFFWKSKAVKKIKPFVTLGDTMQHTEEEQRVNFFIESIGFNGKFAWGYLFCKLLATLSPMCQWYYLCGFIGYRFKYYGLDVLKHFMDDTDSWPNPMDALFPKIAKCEWSHYGFSGDIEVNAAQCQLPMNNITQWTFFIYWIWMVAVIVLNTLSLLYLLFHIFPSYRRYKYRKYVAAACREDVEKLRKVSAPNGEIIRKHSKNKVINVNMSFGDWLVFTMVKRNLEDWKFRDFVRKLATTKNNVVQLKPIAIPLPSFSALNEIKENIENGDGYKAANMEIGFKEALKSGNDEIGFKKGIITPIDTPDFPLNDSSRLPTTPEEFSLNITPPVKIDRKTLSRTSTPNRMDNSKKKNKNPGHHGPQYGWNPGNQVHPQEDWNG